MHRIVGKVFPITANNYVIDELIQWKGVPDDPLFQLTFPHRKMLPPRLFDRLLIPSIFEEVSVQFQFCRFYLHLLDAPL